MWLSCPLVLGEVARAASVVLGEATPPTVRAATLTTETAVWLASDAHEFAVFAFQLVHRPAVPVRCPQGELLPGRTLAVEHGEHVVARTLGVDVMVG